MPKKRNRSRKTTTKKTEGSCACSAKCIIKPLALTVGLFWGLCLLSVTLASYYTGYAEEFLKSIESVYVGFDVSLKGSVVGFVYGFIDGFLGVYVFYYVYKYIAKKCK